MTTLVENIPAEQLIQRLDGVGSHGVTEFNELREFGGNVYECRVLLCPEEDGGFSAHAMRLPGVVSQGDTMDEALVNIEDAFRGAIATYRDDQADIPWTDVDIDRPKGTVEKWILVNT